MFWLGLFEEQVIVGQWSSHNKGSNHSRTKKQWSFVYLEFKRKMLLLHWHFQNKEINIHKVSQVYHHVLRSKSSCLNKNTKAKEIFVIQKKRNFLGIFGDIVFKITDHYFQGNSLHYKKSQVNCNLKMYFLV